MPNSGEGLGEAIPRDSAKAYQALAGEKNLEGSLQVSTILEAPKVKSDAQKPSIIGVEPKNEEINLQDNC